MKSAGPRRAERQRRSRQKPKSIPTAPSGDFTIGTAGASIRIQPNIHFVMEGGYGAIVIRGVSDIGQAIYLGACLLMTAGP